MLLPANNIDFICGFKDVHVYSLVKFLGQWDTGSLGSPGLIVWGIRQHLEVLTLRHSSALGTSPTSVPVGPEAPVISTINRKLQKVT